MSGRKELIFKEYSKKVITICGFGIGFALLSVFLVLLDIKFILAGYRAVYGAIFVCGLMLYTERNKYSSQMAQKHKKYALLAVAASVVLFIIRLINPDFFSYISTGRAGQSISTEFVVAFMLTAVIASPLTDIMFVFKNTKVADTHIPKGDKEN